MPSSVTMGTVLRIRTCNRPEMSSADGVEKNGIDAQTALTDKSIGKISLHRMGIRGWGVKLTSRMGDAGKALAARMRLRFAKVGDNADASDASNESEPLAATIDMSAALGQDAPVNVPVNNNSKTHKASRASKLPEKPRVSRANQPSPVDSAEADSPPESARVSGIHSRQTYSIRREPPRGRMRRRSVRKSRLFRNSMIACALALGIMSLQLLPFPWAQQATQVLSRAVNMNVDLDSTLGQLQFVKNIVPESVLVFWGGGSSAPRSELQAPFEGEVTHEFSSRQPWVEFTGTNQKILCAQSGVVVQLEQSDSGDWAMRVEHDDGLETVYAYLTASYVKVGQTVDRAQELGEAMGQNGARIYFELRKDGTAIDPEPYLEER